MAAGPAEPQLREAAPAGQQLREAAPAGQQVLFSSVNAEPRVIPFDSLTSASERQSIRARAAQVARPEPLQSKKIEAPRARTRAAKSRSADQHRLDFQVSAQSFAPPQSSIICDAPVAPASLRVRAALIDGAFIAFGWLLAAALFRLLGGQLSFDKHTAPFLLAGIATVPLAYKLLWTFAGRDTPGMSSAGLQLVDFDGNRPSQTRRYQRLLGTVLSFLAAGLGLIWVLVDEDSLAWHDHISSTFPAIVSED